jgi:hypothetical protein
LATVNIGNLTFTHRGDYDGSTAYAKNDVVYYSTNGNAYIAKQATTGNVPTNGTYWSQFAQGSGGIWNAGLSLGSANLRMRLMQGGSANTSSEYVYASGLSYTDITPSHLWTTATGAYSDWNSPDNAVFFGIDDHNTAATSVGQLKVNIYNPLGKTNWKYFDVDWKINHTNNWNRLMTGGVLKNTGALSGIQFYYNSGTISSMTNGFKLYGIK